jgi:hypothetical protein
MASGWLDKMPLMLQVVQRSRFARLWLRCLAASLPLHPPPQPQQQRPNKLPVPRLLVAFLAHLQCSAVVEGVGCGVQRQPK